jgi:hypothetical protein
VNWTPTAREFFTHLIQTQHYSLFILAKLLQVGLRGETRPVTIDDVLAAMNLYDAILPRLIFELRSEAERLDLTG